MWLKCKETYYNPHTFNAVVSKDKWYEIIDKSHGEIYGEIYKINFPGNRTTWVNSHYFYSIEESRNQKIESIFD